jgi:glycosyltransferase involved in cell wall biosynthesis
MKKKLALIIISLDECFSVSGFSGGGHKVTKNLILGLIESNLFEIDIFCKKADLPKPKEINSINVLNKKTFIKDLKEKLKEKKYDYVLSSDILLPFGNVLLHSNSAKYKSENGKNIFLQKILKIYNAKKINRQQKYFDQNNKAVFTVSESLKKDYTQNYNLDESKVFACHPAVDKLSDFIPPKLKKEFIIGSIVGGGINKGGYLLLFALKRLPKDLKLKARLIFPKFHKSFFFQFMIKFLGLQDRIELLAKQADMEEYYKTIDCYVLPSLNEAFGLVVTEAASNFKPSLVSSTVGVRELVDDNFSGFVFERKHNPVKNLVDKLTEITALYFNEHEKFVEISKNADGIAKKLSWKKFNNTIITNMIGEK